MAFGGRVGEAGRGKDAGGVANDEVAADLGAADAFRGCGGHRERRDGKRVSRCVLVLSVVASSGQTFEMEALAGRKWPICM